MVLVGLGMQVGGRTGGVMGDELGISGEDGSTRG